ncbi:hypothetical protein TrCOL_g6726 [Triparma columacea]|uniref:Uncharacterized protein n=1 Tax=Triparma columacea TaxID=722753 RepID=A0A9W7L777_9STRA|nr:hypothetical protein TrCOL_g6726 [Triparma columacea]
MKSLSFTSTVSPPSPLSRASGVQKPTLLCAEKKKKNVVKLDEAVKAKLLAESIAPWRTVRLFLYGSFGSGAFVGGFLTLAGLIAAKSGARSDVDIDEYTLNVAIDFGAATFFAVAAYLDTKRGAELSDAVEAKIERKKASKEQMKASNERWTREFRALQVAVNLGGGEDKETFVKDLQDGAAQNLVVLAGNKAFLKDALLSAKLAQPGSFQQKDVLLIPVSNERAPVSVASEKGFAAPASVSPSSSPLYVANPSGEGWRDLVEREMQDAEGQGGEGKLVRDKGMVIVIDKNGEVKRRGVGTPSWTMVFDDF